MAYDPNLPANGSPIVSAELRNQFNGLNDKITALQAQVTQLQNDLGNKATKPTAGEFDPGFNNDPVRPADMENVRSFLNDLVQQLEN